MQNPHRRCEGNFAGKYLAGDVLKAKCGASIRVEVLDRSTAESVTASEALEDIRLEVRPGVSLALWLAALSNCFRGLSFAGLVSEVVSCLALLWPRGLKQSGEYASVAGLMEKSMHAAEAGFGGCQFFQP